MQNHFKYSLLIILILLTGCEPQHRILNVPESDWRCLCSADRAAAIQNYNEEQAAKARANPPYCTLQRHLHNLPTCYYNPYFGH